MANTPHWRIAGLPSGYSLDQLRTIEVTATVAIPSEAEALEALAHVAGTKVAGPPLMKAGKPTILKVAAWMLHTDVPNANGDLFLQADIEAVAASLFRAPHFGVMDWNHAAVLNFNDDPKVIGVWYDAELRFDAAAQAPGLLVSGMVFAWLFPEQTDAMLAEQARSGSVKFSMAAIPAEVTLRTGPNGESISVLHRPVFFTNSALDKPPADKHALGRVSEDTDVDAAALKQELAGTVTSGLAHCASAGTTSATTTTSTTGTTGTAGITYTIHGPHTLGGNTLYIPGWPVTTGGLTAPITQVDLTQAPPAAGKDTAMNEELIATLKAEKAASEAKVAELTARAEAESLKLTATEQSRDAGVAELATLQARVAELETQIAELTTAREAIVAERDGLVARVSELEATNVALVEKVTAFEAVATEQAQATLIAERLAELPAEFVEAFRKQDEDTQTKLTAKWMALASEDWEAYKKNELLFGLTVTASKKGDYVGRSKAEGDLPGSGGAEGSIKARLAAHIKR